MAQHEFEEALEELRGLYYRNGEDLRHVVFWPHNLKELDDTERRRLYEHLLIYRLGRFDNGREGMERRILFEIDQNNRYAIDQNTHLVRCNVKQWKPHELPRLLLSVEKFRRYVPKA